MMYQEKFVVAIKVGGKVLRETKDLVQLPFGSEFSVLVKNLNSRRAKFTLDIDGTNVLDDTEIIVDANSEVEMKRFIRNGNMDEGNAFKFIERTAAIEDGPRGIRVDDGIVRVEFWFEKEKPRVVETIYDNRNVWRDRYGYRITHWETPYGGPYFGISGNAATTSAVGGGTLSSTASATSATLGNASSAFRSANITSKGVAQNASVDVQNATSDVGITVAGSKVEQKFTTVYGFDSETQSHVIILRLAGRAGEVQIAAPVTVKTKNICSTCSHTNKHSAKFCSQCGTALELV